MSIQDEIYYKIINTFGNDCLDLNPIMKMIKQCEDRGEDLQERGFLTDGIIIPNANKVWVGIGYNKIDYPEDIQLLLNNSGISYYYLGASFMRFKDLEEKGIDLQTMNKGKSSFSINSNIDVASDIEKIKFSMSDAKKIEILPRELYGKDAIRIINNENCYFDLLCLECFRAKSSYNIEDIKEILKGIIDKVNYNRAIIAKSEDGNRTIFITKKILES